jgi:DNA-binding Lrp family transcriptional regulator
VLEKHGRISNADLAARVGLSPSSVAGCGYSSVSG